jgi:hypothetical protein
VRSVEQPASPKPALSATERALKIGAKNMAAWNAGRANAASAPSRQTAPAAERASADQTPLTQPGSGAQRPPALIEPVRIFDETISLVAKAAVFGSPQFPREKETVTTLARETFRDPEILIASIIAALDREPQDFEQHVARLVDEAVARGELRGKAGFFASRADKELHAASLGRSGALKLYAQDLHGWVHRERRSVEAIEQKRRQRLGRAIPMPSERLRGVLDELNAAPAFSRATVIAKALRDAALGRELWGFAKAVGERFGEAPQSATGPEGEGEIVEALSRSDRERLPELRPLIDAGRHAAREVRRVEESREERRLAQAIELSQEQGLSPGL